MINFKGNSDSGTMKVLLNVLKSSATSTVSEIGGAKWFFVVEEGLNTVAQQNVNAWLVHEVVYVDELDFQDQPLPYRRLPRRDGSIRLLVYCSRESHAATCKSKYSVRLVGSRNEVVINGDFSFGKKDSRLKKRIIIEPFIKWNHIVDPSNGFVDENNNLAIFVDIFTKNTIEPIKIGNSELFSAKTSFPFADCILVVENQKLYLNKDYLSIHSAVFKAMFKSNFREKSVNEIELKNVNCADFVELLAVIYPSRRPITDANVERLLKMADRFEVLSIIDMCIWFLKYESVLSVGKKWLLAQRLQLDDLKLFLSKRCFSVKELKKLDEEFLMLEPESKCMLLDQLLKSDS